MTHIAQGKDGYARASDGCVRFPGISHEEVGRALAQEGWDFYEWIKGDGSGKGYNLTLRNLPLPHRESVVAAKAKIAEFAARRGWPVTIS